MSTSTTITLQAIATTPEGMVTWRISARDVRALQSALPSFDPSAARGPYRIRRDGTLRFTSGGGYDIVSADLLGGAADGARRLEAERAGLRFTLK